jgi:hypothetical protein
LGASQTFIPQKCKYLWGAPTILMEFPVCLFLSVAHLPYSGLLSTPKS